MGSGRSGRGHRASSPREGAARALYARSLSRRALLRGALGAAFASLAGGAGAQTTGARDERMQRIADVIAEYDAQGEHRSGTYVDEASARWVVRELAGAGLSGRLERFDFQRFVQRRADVVCGGERRHGFAAHDGGITGPDGVTGRLGRLGSRAEIAVALVAPSPKPAVLAELERVRIAGTHRAIVVLPERGSAHGDLAVINAEHAATPDATPLVQLAGTHSWPLQTGMQEGAAARVIVEAERAPAEGLNVTARLRGTQPELAPLIVMTPRSGWFGCASERGGGLAAFFEIARALYDAPPARDVHFVATSGHELGHLGLRAWLGWHETLAASAHAWLHLGANFAAVGGQVALQASSAEYAELARAAFASAGPVPELFAPPGSPPLGEAREIADRPYLSILGTNPRFHTPDDRWPYAVDLDKTGAMCDALIAIAGRLAS